MKNGKGKIIYSNGNEYEGEWKDDKKNGKGEIFHINEQEKFKGEFENNIEKDGEGIIIKENYIYNGKIRDYKKNGYGKIYYNDGNKYYGNFENEEYIIIKIHI